MYSLSNKEKMAAAEVARAVESREQRCADGCSLCPCRAGGRAGTRGWALLPALLGSSCRADVPGLCSLTLEWCGFSHWFVSLLRYYSRLGNFTFVRFCFTFTA